ncbi:hypothetical protein RhiirA5_498676 [Rhizophagus irregularis]|uniref:F-box domain-containing protein n=2 Tax=Rhizophagus irregularis TaxID=588596 RepID=A0A2I1DWM9_9GLOM|nr:hypothetical protein RirG_032770 [Rhizophagus irregularis DAOM 197198w]PKC10165.1 hypothetical protein RhiirA5_498676 [Rhizophagus irregularis]GBC16168.2 hypothetical protein GLOIN_2v1784116 [Rhizophagus irregularis DAOM 181602=DAOM 197198]PKC75816.1 hypothetical protein RhiirA1_495140 [Rhizophagus irregularis]PKK60199.1 hypothetical protein RhiirC2_856978 [Rhizophagus irregularis]
MDKSSSSSSSLSSQISSPQIISLQNSFNKPIPYLPPEIVTEIVSYISEDDIKSLYSIIQINKTWFNCSIHVLWKQPFKYTSLTGYSKLLKIYIWFLPEKTKMELRKNVFKFDVKEFNKIPTVNYLNYLENLELEYRSLYWAIKLLLPTLKSEEKEEIEEEENHVEIKERKEKEEQEAKNLRKVQANALLKELIKLYKENCPKLKKFKMNDPTEHLKLTVDELDHICTNPTDQKTRIYRSRRKLIISC